MTASKAEFNPRSSPSSATGVPIGADLAGTSRIQYPSNVQMARVMRSGAVGPVFALKSLLEGADGVLIGGCHPGDCDC